MKLQVAKPAEHQTETMDAWWVEHRPDAPAVFANELSETLRYICQMPNAGIPWPTQRRPTLRRVLMRKTRNHVYFFVDETTEIIHVIAISGARKGRAPEL